MDQFIVSGLFFNLYFVKIDLCLKEFINQKKGKENEPMVFEKE